MTKAIKAVKRETFSSVRVRGQLRPLIIEIHPSWIYVRAKGMRHSYSVTMDQLWNLGAKNQANANGMERIESKIKAKQEAK